MKTRTTVILLVIVLAVAAYIRFYERNQPNTEEANRRAQNVITFDRDAIDGLMIQNGDDRIELRKDKNKWRMESPVKDQADSSVAERILSDLAAWQKFDTIPAKELQNDKKKLEEFGLLQPKLKVRLSGRNAPVEIYIGSDAALEGQVYVQLANAKDVLLASRSVRDDAAKKPDEFRDKKLTDLTAGQITRVVFRSPTGEMELEKAADHWQLLKPMRARADDQKVSDLIAQITTMQAQQFVTADGGDLHPSGLADPRGSVTLYSAETKEGQVLSIGAPYEKQKEQIYARSSTRGAIFTVARKVEDVLNTKPGDLRDRHLVRFDSNMLDRISIEAAGRSKLVLARKAEKWTLASRNDQPVNAAEVTRLLDTLKNAQVTAFVEDVASNLPKYGLDKPLLQLTLSSFASEPTAETKAGERPFATVTFGKTEGDQCYARLEEEPFVVLVPRKLLEAIPADPLQLQELTIFNYKPDEVHRLSIVTDRELSLTRGENNDWAWVVGTGQINQVNVQSLVNTLARLRAVRWLGATLPAQALDRPSIAITFTTSSDDKHLHKLLVGGATPEGMFFARTDEREGTFVLSAPDVNALRLSLAAASPTPSGGTPSPTPPATQP